MFTETEIAEYKNTAYPFSLNIIDKALKREISKNASYEVWVPFIYYKYRKKGLLSEIAATAPPGLFVSNLGRVCRNLNGKVKIFSPFMGNKDGYWLISFATNKCVNLHRLIGCCFIPPEEGHPMDQQVNHKNGKKLDIALSNLEWTTHGGNIKHARETGLMRIVGTGKDHPGAIPVKGVVIKGEFKGYSFILTGLAEKREHGFTPDAINSCYMGRIRSHRLCTWTVATPEEINSLPNGVTKEIRAWIDNNKKVKRK
jgi:hypothetical protein